jgi:hypothetical protein
MLCELSATALARRAPRRPPYADAKVSGNRTLVVLAMSGLVVVAACGRDQPSSQPATTAPVTLAPVTTRSRPPSTTVAGPIPITHPTGPDEAVVRLTVGGGLVPEGADFRAPPQLLILGDGTVLRPGPQAQVYPGPMLPPVTMAKLDDAGLQLVLRAAREGGLLANPPAYDLPPGGPSFDDAPATTVELHAGGRSFTHTAYALGLTRPEVTPARAALEDYVATLADLPALLAAHIGPETAYEPERLGVIARAATPEELAPPEGGLAPATVPWPASAGDLATSAGRCVEMPAAPARSLLNSANLADHFSENGTTYIVYVRVLLPDETCAQFS